MESTPVHVPQRLELSVDERAELENFRNMFGRLRLGPSTFESSPADVSNIHFSSPSNPVSSTSFVAGTHVPRV